MKTRPPRQPIDKDKIFRRFARDIVGVQPLTGPTGQIFKLNFPNAILLTGDGLTLDVDEIIALKEKGHSFE